jgi:putative transcriptional regulator
MTIRHHINDDILMSYAAGSLTEGWSLLVATHLALCPTCRARSLHAEAIGGWLLESLEASEVSAGALESVQARIRFGQRAPARVESAPPIGRPKLPEPLRSYLGGDLDRLKWRHLGPRAYHVPIKIRHSQTQARMLRLTRGMAVPVHGHRGRELTLVLAGVLCDSGEVFAQGDVEEADESVEHQPVAGSQEDCICLAVTDAPLRFKSLAARLVQPFIGI